MVVLDGFCIKLGEAGNQARLVVLDDDEDWRTPCSNMLTSFFISLCVAIGKRNAVE